MPTINKLLQFSDSLYIEAGEIVQKLDLLKIANKYSQAYQIGSSVLNLMVDRDIDFTCYHKTTVDQNKCLSFVKEIINIPGCEVLKIKNYVNNPDYHQFKVNIDPYVYNGYPWKIAFSFQLYKYSTFQNDVGTLTWVKNKLTEKARASILQIKHASRKEGKKIPGYYVYRAVLEKGAGNLEEVKEYLESQTA